MHKYDEALVEFKSLLVEHPDHVMLKRYIAACLNELRRDDEAFAELEAILEARPEDLPSLKLLAKMHLRRGENEKAKTYLEQLAALDNTPMFSGYAQDQLEKLKTIEAASAGEEGRQIVPSEFLKTKAAVHFMDAQYEEAVAEFAKLEAQYPDDVMVKRYKGMALDKLGRFEEAVAAFNEGIAISPSNAALRYSLAQTLFHNKDIPGATAELKFVSENDAKGDYKIRADRDLEALQKIEQMLRAAEAKPWSVYVEQGFEWNSNATAEPKKRQVPAEEHAVRFPSLLVFNQQLHKNGPWSLSGTYIYSGSYYSDTIDYLNAVVNIPTLTLTHVGQVKQKPFVTQFSYNYTHVAVEDEYYYQSYPASIRLIYSFWDWHRIIFSEKIAWTDYKDQGTVPANDSREGTTNTLSVTNNFYFNDKKNLYLGTAYEYKADDVEGSIYVKNSHQASVDWNFPISSHWRGIVNFKFKNTDYPETNALIQRNDDEYAAGLRLTLKLNGQMSVRFSYDYLNNDSNDPIYNYVNHAGGAVLVANF